MRSPVKRSPVKRSEAERSAATLESGYVVGMHRARPSIAPALVAAALAVLAGCAEAPAGRPNFVLCMADDLGWGDVGYRGDRVPRTPTLDAMAASGLRLERFYAASPTCSPTRASVLTGRHPNRFGCFTWGHALRPEELTVAEALRSAGYATGHFGKWHVGSVRAGDPDCPGESGFEEWLTSPNFFENDPHFSHNGRPEQRLGESSAVVVEAALEFIRGARERGQPFLAVVWFSAPHDPYTASKADLAAYAEEPEERRGYYAEITAMDRALGSLRRGLAELDLSRSTLVWFTSDNGASGAEEGELAGSKGSLAEGGIRVPCVLEWPGRIRRGQHAGPCGTVDIHPTLLELAGVEVALQPGPLDGTSLAPLLSGRPFARPQPLGFWVRPAAGIFVRSQVEIQALSDGTAPRRPAQREPPIAPDEVEIARGGEVAWIDGRYKLRGRIAAGGAELELFDLEADPHEGRDLAAGQPERARRMLAELEAWQASVLQSLGGADYRP
jgi:arylsulfatase A-like enzyme